MPVPTSLTPGSAEMVKHGDPKRRAEAASRIAELFLLDAPRLQPSHVELFDELLIDLVPFTETNARAELAERLSFVANAPPALLGQLPRDNELLVPPPTLRP